MLKQQPNYELKPEKPIQVHAQQIPIKCKIQIVISPEKTMEVLFESGDWLITMADGNQSHWTNKDFMEKFQPIKRFDEDFYLPGVPKIRPNDWLPKIPDQYKIKFSTNWPGDIWCGIF